MGLRPLHKNLLPSAGLASFLGHGCLSGTWTRMLLARLQGRHTMGAQGWLLQWSVRWLPGPCLVAQRNQESQSRTLTLLQLTSPGSGASGLSFGKFPSLFSLPHHL